MDLRDKVVLITGASGGIGAACAAAFHRRGAKLALAARSRDNLERVAHSTDALILPGDLLDSAARKSAVEATLARYQRIDVLVNNAGVGLYASTWKAPLDEVRRMLELNFFAAVEMIQLTAPHMIERRSGSIVNISSIGGKVPLPWFTLYTASKYALSGLTEGLRIELSPHNVHCMLVCPGYVKTGFQQNALAGQPPERLWRARKFAITPEQCAEAVVRGVERGKRTVVVPRLGWALMAFRALLPRVVDARLESIYRGLGMS
jgi:short-subunit dehydrogenase